MKILFLFICFTQNNIFLTLTTYQGKVIFWKSLGSFKIKGLKKLSNSLLKNFIFSSFKILQTHSNLKFHIKLKGSNKFKKYFMRNLFIHLRCFSIVSIKDLFLNSYNGCKFKKKRYL